MTELQFINSDATPKTQPLHGNRLKQRRKME